MLVAELETPALVIDIEIMQRNLQRLAGYTREHRLRLRPHTKTHKIPELARMQLALGATGLTVAKVGEAEVMLQVAPDNILVEYPIVGRGKLQRLARVASETHVSVAVDSLDAARQLSDAAVEASVRFGILAEADVGLGRVGVQPGEPLRRLSRDIAALPNVDFQGISFFPGHIRRFDDQGLLLWEKLNCTVAAMIADVRAEGLSAAVVTGGSTSTAFRSHLLAGITEIRSGTYVFNDRNTVFTEACSLEDCAASVLVTVVSTAVAGQVIVDGGSKTFSSDSYWGPEISYGHVREAPEARFVRMSEEHGFIDIRQSEHNFRVGERLHVIPNHICPAINLQDQVYGVSGERVEQVWMVAARGKLQ